VSAASSTQGWLRTSCANMDAAWWRLRIEMALRVRSQSLNLRPCVTPRGATCRWITLTGIYNRETLMAVLFRETDRVQTDEKLAVDDPV